MNRIYRYIAASLVALSAVGVTASPRSVKMTLDSAAVVMGRINGLNVEVVTTRDANGTFKLDTDSLAPYGIEVYDEGDVQREDVGDNIVQLTRKYYIQAFDSGTYTIPGIMYIEGHDTVMSGPVSMKVLPVDVSQLEDVHPDADVLNPERRWYDFIPDFITDYWVWWLIGLLVIAGGICAALIFTRKIEVRMPRKAPVPPDRIAMRKLAKLRESKLCENGREKEYYTRLVDILREYLQKRFGINAMEMTSTQILNAVRNNPTASLSKQNIKDIVSIADFVKFAQVRPMPDDNAAAMRSALQFVENTRPTPETATDNTTTTTNSKDK